MKATKDLLEQLHGMVAQSMLDALESGEATAAQWSAITKFLRENGVSAVDGLGGDADEAFANLAQRAQALIAAHNGGTSH